MPKRKCKFSENYTLKWSFIKRGRIDQEAECKKCNCFFTVAYGGKSDIVQHISTRKHLISASYYARDSTAVAATTTTPSPSPDDSDAATDDDDEEEEEEEEEEEKPMKIEPSFVDASELCSVSMDESCSTDDGDTVATTLSCVYDNCHVDNNSLVDPDEEGEEAAISSANWATAAYHTIKANHSFCQDGCQKKRRSQVSHDVIRFPPPPPPYDNVTSAIINDVLAPHTVREVVKDLSDSQYYGIFTSSRYYRTNYLCALVIQYFTLDRGIRVKLLCVSDFSNGEPKTVESFYQESLRNLGIDLDSCVSYCEETANTNYGGRLRHCENKIKIQNFLAAASRNTSTTVDLNDEHLERTDDLSDVLHNVLQIAIDVLSIDIEVIVSKLIAFFRTNNIRSKIFHEFCIFINSEKYHDTTASPCSVNWDVFFKAIDHIINVFDELKSYFLSEEKPPRILVNYFRNPLCKAYLVSIRHLESVLYKRGSYIVSDNGNSIVDILNILTKTTTRLTIAVNRSKLRQFEDLKMLLKSYDVTDAMKAQFYSELTDMYITCFDYLKMWRAPLEHLSVFSWMSLDILPKWKQVDATHLYLQSKGIQLDDYNLLRQWSVLKDLLEQKLLTARPDWIQLRCNHKWLEILRQMGSKESCSELLTLCQYMFSIHVCNDQFQRLFSEINHQLKMDPRLDSSSAESIMQCLVNLDMTCPQFYKYALNDKQLLTDVTNVCQSNILLNYPLLS